MKSGARQLMNVRPLPTSAAKENDALCDNQPSAQRKEERTALSAAVYAAAIDAVGGTGGAPVLENEVEQGDGASSGDPKDACLQRCEPGISDRGIISACRNDMEQAGDIKRSSDTHHALSV